MSFLQICRQSGWYLPCKVDEKAVYFLVDSGASCSLIDYPVYQAVGEELQLNLEPVQDHFVLANGSNLKVHREVKIVLHVGESEFPQSMTVASFEGHSAILHSDFFSIMKLLSSCLMVNF